MCNCLKLFAVNNGYDTIAEFIIIIITFISGAKPIAENRHNMKRTKIKHTTHTCTNQSIEKTKIKN